ncbi:MAG: exosortase A, partial [Rhodanobacteraceae bacterium]
MNTRLATGSGASIRMSAWTLALAAFGVAVVVLLACYWQTVVSLIHVWSHDGTYQYAFLIFPLSAWVAFDMRYRLRAYPPAPSVWGLVGVAVLVIIWYAGHMLDINLPQHFAFVALFPALVLACWGWRAVWTLKFPLAYLVVFAVPWGDSLVGPLQDITARFAVHALNLTGTPVLLNGREIMTPSAVWMVAQACSGVKFFIACTALGCLFSYLMYSRGWKRVVFVLVSAIAPIIANGLRVYFTILIGETFGLHYATGTDHMIFGWQFFGTVLIVLFLVGWFFRDRPVAREKPPEDDHRRAGARVAVWPVAFALLIVGPVLAAGVAGVRPSAERLQVSAPVLPGWSGPVVAPDGWKPSFSGAAGSFKVAYLSGSRGDAVELFHAVYLGKPRRGHDLITYGNDVYDPARSRIIESSGRRVD